MTKNPFTIDTLNPPICVSSDSNCHSVGAGRSSGSPPIDMAELAYRARRMTRAWVAAVAGREWEKVTAVLASVALGGLGFGLIALAWRMDAKWAEAHFLPVWAWTWEVQLRILLALQLAIVAASLGVLLGLRPWFAQACVEGRALAALGSVTRVTLAVIAALVAAELVLRTRTWRAAQEQWNLEEPLRIRDREYGWGFASNHFGTVELDGRTVHYATGPYGYRTSRPGIAPDFSRPTIVFAGESIVFGYGLDWHETLPARVQAITGIQTANIAIHAHATDQAYLRLRRELPRFAHPVAVVIPFMPRLLDRNLDVDKPHLDDRLLWQPAAPPPLQLLELTRRVLRFRDPSAIARGEVQTSKVLQAAITMAEARGARAIILVPQYLPEEPVERRIRYEVLDRVGIRYLLVPIPQKWRSPTHSHPTPEGATALAVAVGRAISASEASPALVK